LTKFGKVPVNAAKQSSQRAATSVSTARHVNTVASRPNVNSTLPTKYSYYKAHSPSYLTNYQEIDGGFVAFGGNAKGGQAIKKIVPGPQYVLLPLLTTDYQGLKSSEDEVADDAGKKSTKVPRKEEGVQDPAKEGDKDDQQKDVRDQEEASRKQFEQESERLFGQGEATSTKSTNRLNIVSSPVNAVSSSFTTVDLGRERA
nr:hypothetical protein [Tanacetum cinerariifolium]